MAVSTERDQKLVQYLNEAYGKEKELEVALQAHIGMTDRAPYKKRLRKHLTETKGHARAVERRIKRLGGSPAATQRFAGQATAALKGQVHALRGGGGEEEKLLKNAKTEYSEEAEEIATYTAIEAFAESVGDRETVKLARGIRREEERMAAYLAGLIPQLARATARAQVPSDQMPKARRRTSGGRKASARTSGARRRTSGGRKKVSASTSRARRRTSGGRKKVSAGTSGRRMGAARRSGRSTTSARSRKPSRR